MNDVKTLLDQAMQATGAKNENQLASKLCLPSQRISDYYKGQRVPNEFACLKIAEALGKDYAEISATVQIAAEKDESRKKAWREYAKRLGGIATSFMTAALLTLLSVTFIVTNDAKATENQQVKSGDLQIIQIMRFLVGFFQRLNRICAAYERHLFSACRFDVLAR